MKKYILLLLALTLLLCAGCGQEAPASQPLTPTITPVQTEAPTTAPAPEATNPPATEETAPVPALTTGTANSANCSGSSCS